MRPFLLDEDVLVSFLFFWLFYCIVFDVFYNFALIIGYRVVIFRNESKNYFFFTQDFVAWVLSYCAALTKM